MADKTFGVKVSEELYEKVREMVDVSGITTKEWFEKAVALTEMNEIKQGAPDYKQDLSELEVHTSRIYELVSNMIQRSIYIKEHAVREYADKLEQKEDIISEYQFKAAEAIEKAKIADETVKLLEKEKEEFIKQSSELRSVNANNQLLINEYKEKNDTLNGLVSKYQSYAEENEKLKGDFAKEKEQLQSKIQEIMILSQKQETKVNELTQKTEAMERDHKIEIERINERKDFEKERALIEVEREYQAKFLASNEEYNDKLGELYDEISSIRMDYEGKIATLQEQLEEKRK